MIISGKQIMQSKKVRIKYFLDIDKGYDGGKRKRPRIECSERTKVNINFIQITVYLFLRMQKNTVVFPSLTAKFVQFIYILFKIKKDILIGIISGQKFPEQRQKILF